MLLRGLELVKKLLKESEAENEGSVGINDPKVLRKYIDDPSFPFLVSFPRTGSHWLRMVMELYFERPLLTRTFYFNDRKDYLLLHTHDIELDVKRENVIYLYRDPVDTVFSQLMYYKESPDDRRRIEHWSGLYGRHLSKWLHEDNFTRKKTVIRYERLRTEPEKEFRKITGHFAAPFDELKLKKAFQEVTKEKVKEKTLHDQQVVPLKEGYAESRDRFRAGHAELVWSTLTKDRTYLKEDF